MKSEGAQFQSSLARHLAPAMDGMRDSCAQSSGLTAALLALIVEFITRLFLRLDGLAALWEAGQLPQPAPAIATPRRTAASASRRRVRSQLRSCRAPAVPAPVVQPVQAERACVQHRCAQPLAIRRVPRPVRRIFSKQAHERAPNCAHFIASC